MSEMSDMHKLIMAMKLAKTAQVGLELTYFDVIELLGELESLKDYIAELEGRIDQLTARLRQERQDDKSSNDTQLSTFAYGGKDSKPLPYPLCGNIVDGKEGR